MVAASMGCCASARACCTGSSTASTAISGIRQPMGGSHRATIARRQINKQALQRRFGLDEHPDRLLLAAIARFTLQKGVDLLAGAAPALHAVGAQLAILGAGERDLENRIA